ncbi:MAG: hypothetical protein JWQ96_982 [Segetibacter sp.]|nr:hypothetical protein [Segetibacter sp.]
MHIKVALTEDIINQSLALHYNNQPRARRKKRELFIIPGMLILLAGYLIYTEAQRPTPGHNYYMALLYITFALLYFYTMRKRLYNAGGKILKNLDEYANYTLEVTPDQITTTTASDTLLSYWSDFTGALISSDLVLLYQPNESFIMLHSSFFDSNDLENFKQLVEEKVQPVLKA